MKTPLVSIVVPVYNVEKYIKKCLDSIINQTYDNLEIIIIDDCTPDGSGMIADEYSYTDSRIKVVHKNKNKGLSEARHSGLKRSNGEYIMFVDSDDIILPNTVSRCIDSIISSDSDICAFSFENFTEDYELNNISKNKSSKAVKIKDPLDLYLFYNKYNISFPYYDMTAWGKMYKTELLHSINWELINFKINEDNAFILYPYKSSSKGMVIISDKLYLYRQREDSIVKSTYSNYYHDKKITRMEFVGKLFNVDISILGSNYKTRLTNRIMAENIWLYKRDLAGVDPEAQNIDERDTEVFKNNIELMMGDYLSIDPSESDPYIRRLVEKYKSNGMTGFVGLLLKELSIDNINIKDRNIFLENEVKQKESLIRDMYSIKKSLRLLAVNIKRRIF